MLRAAVLGGTKPMIGFGDPAFAPNQSAGEAGQPTATVKIQALFCCRACYHFATELFDTGCYEMILAHRRARQKGLIFWTAGVRMALNDTGDLDG
jgi:hypothetical protein